MTIPKTDIKYTPEEPMQELLNLKKKYHDL
jgi:hypothetical protein